MIVPRRSFTAIDVVAVLQDVVDETGMTRTYACSGNRPACTAKALTSWCNTAGIGTAFIDPDPPQQGGFAESSNAQFRREQRSGESMDTMAVGRYLARDIYKQ